MELLLAIISGLALGVVHAFDVDHIAAVTAFASDHPNPKKAATVGIAWGVGHTTTLILLGGISVLFRFVIPPILESVSELTIGFLLISIGSWVIVDLFRNRRTHLHRHVHDGYEHVHFHSHRKSADHHHRHSMFLVGAAHGFAGTASVMVLVPVTLSQSVATAAGYLILFGIGTVVAMGCIALIVGSAAQRVRSTRLLPFLRLASGVASLAIGCVWIGQRILS